MLHICKIETAHAGETSSFLHIFFLNLFKFIKVGFFRTKMFKKIFNLLVFNVV